MIHQSLGLLHTANIGNKSAKALGERPIDLPLALTSTAILIVFEGGLGREMGIMKPRGRVIGNDEKKTVLGWVNSRGTAYRNDYERTTPGRVDLGTGEIFDEHKSRLGRVDEAGMVYLLSSETAFGQVKGPPDSYKYGACALLTLWGWV